VIRAAFGSRGDETTSARMWSPWLDANAGLVAES
jgi:hypothetical protein